MCSVQCATALSKFYFDIYFCIKTLIYLLAVASASTPLKAWAKSTLQAMRRLERILNDNDYADNNEHL